MSHLRSIHSSDEEDSESDIGNGTCVRLIMTDLSGEDILKLQDELQLLRSENCRLKNTSECLTEASFQENNAKGLILHWSSFIYNVDGCLCMCFCPCHNSSTNQSNIISTVCYGPDEAEA